MRTLELRRHSLRVRPGERLSQEGVSLLTFEAGRFTRGEILRLRWE
jgi:hypothetical protein